MYRYSSLSFTWHSVRVYTLSGEDRTSDSKCLNVFDAFYSKNTSVMMTEGFDKRGVPQKGGLLCVVRWLAEEITVGPE